MRKNIFIFTAILSACAGSINAQNLVKYVQPLSGTAASTTAATVKHSIDGTERFANTIPAVGVPFGMTQWTPQTQVSEKKCLPPYMYRDTKINGFRGTHWISGSCTQDYGSVTIMPVTGKLRTTLNEYATSFSHNDEVTAPHYYSVILPEYSLKAELTGTARSGMMQFTINKSDSLYLLVMPNSDQGKGFVKVDREKGEIYGYNPAHRIYQGWGEPAGFSGYFIIQIDKQAGRMGTFEKARVLDSESIADRKDIGAFVGLKLNKGDKLRIRIGTSFTGFEGARKNLESEVSSWNFKSLVKQNKSVWQKALKQAKVKTPIEKDKRVFYTAFYHSMQHPRLFNDVDGSYPAFAGNASIQNSGKGNYYDDFSMWDIYRAQLPLFEILRPALINDMVVSMINKGQQGRWLPIFPCWNSYTSAMIGDHGTAFIASAYTKGIRNYDTEAAYRLMRKNAFEIAGAADYKNGMGRRALDTYMKYNYVPMEDSVPVAFHKKEQVSRTLEYAFDDYALAMFAKGLGKTDDYELLMKRAMNYKNVFDPAVGLMRGRHADGSWYKPFNPDKKEPYITEGTPRQYTFYVPHDVPGLAGLMGGADKLEAALDTLFAKGEYWHGNEPGHQIPFMYNYTSSPWKTQKEVHRILAEEYSDGPGGLSGNDDAGQMSAWYVFAALGFYPVDPVSDQYALSAPLFDKYSISLPDNKTFKVITRKKSPGSKYISKIKWNGINYTKNYITHGQVMQGGKLQIYLTDEPSKAWAKDETDRPVGLNK